MSIKPYFFATVQGGRLLHDNAENWAGYVRQFEGEKVRLTIEKKPARRSTRSQAQNAYYWGIVLPTIGEDLGYPKEEMHLAFTNHFLKHKVPSEKTEGWIEVPRSTTTLSTSEFCEYVDQIKAWAAKYRGVYIPDPDTVEMMT